MNIFRNWASATTSIIAAIAAIVAAYVAAASGREATRKDYVSLALSTLTSKDSSPALRGWAVDVLNDLSPVPLPADLRIELKTGRSVLATPSFDLPEPLLANPPEIPRMERQPDGSMTSAQALKGMIDLYAVSGRMRLQLQALIDAERTRQALLKKRPT